MSGYLVVYALCSEQDLLKRAQRGSDAALNELFLHLGPKVLDRCLTLSRERDDAEDLTQEILLKVHRHLHRFRGDSSLFT